MLKYVSENGSDDTIYDDKVKYYFFSFFSYDECWQKLLSFKIFNLFFLFLLNFVQF